MFVLGKDKYLLLVDYYSKYFELIRVTDSTSNTVVNVLQQHLARYGLPEILYTDSGPEFASKGFFNFVRKYQFQHVTSSPTFPQSNGLSRELYRQQRNC
jgi:transposase InsO family protein